MYSLGSKSQGQVSGPVQQGERGSYVGALYSFGIANSFLVRASSSVIRFCSWRRVAPCSGVLDRYSFYKRNILTSPALFSSVKVLCVGRSDSQVFLDFLCCLSLEARSVKEGQKSSKLSSEGQVSPKININSAITYFFQEFAVFVEVCQAEREERKCYSARTVREVDPEVGVGEPGESGSSSSH